MMLFVFGLRLMDHPSNVFESAHVINSAALNVRHCETAFLSVAIVALTHKDALVSIQYRLSEAEKSVVTECRRDAEGCLNKGHGLVLKGMPAAWTSKCFTLYPN